MLNKFIFYSQRYYSHCISKVKKMNLDKCYFRFLEKEEKIDITFLLTIKESIRQFNLSRKPSESLQVLLSRIGANVQKALNKANKAKKNTSNEIEVKFYDGKNEPIPESLTCMQLFEMNGPIIMRILDQTLEIGFNVPWVISMNLPQSLLVGFPVYPEHFKTHFTKPMYCQYNWYSASTKNDKGAQINDKHLNWKFVGNGFIYKPTVADIGKKLKLECIPGNEEEKGPVVEVVSKNVVEAGPGYCPFETRHMFTTQKLSGKSFRCVTYNILANLYCDSEYTRTVLHPYCPAYALHIDYRKQLILKEILGYNADIINLQECDYKIFISHLKPLLDNEGYGGEFAKKGKEVAEGLACFYRRDRFELLKSEKIVLAEALRDKKCLEDIWKAVQSNEKLKDRVLDRSSIASATVFKSLENPNEILLIGNTHLYFHPDADHIRLIQGGIVIYWLKELKENLSKEFPDKRISLILSGDFNSVPSCGIYKLYTTGAAESSLPDWKSNTEEAIQNLNLNQNIILESACGTPQFTNFTEGFADCLDYIFIEKSNLEVEQVVPFPSVEELQAHTALPSIVFPSDHISLISDLRFM